MKKLFLVVLILLFIPAYIYAWMPVIMTGGSTPFGCSEPIDEDDWTSGDLSEWDLSAFASGASNALVLTYDASQTAYVQEDDLPGEPITEFSIQFNFLVTNGAGTYNASDGSSLFSVSTNTIISLRSAAGGNSISDIRATYYDDTGAQVDTQSYTVNEATTYYMRIYRKRATGPGANDGIMKVWISTTTAFGAALISVTNVDDETKTGLGYSRLGGPGDFYDGANTYTITIDDYKLRSNEECFD